MMSSSSLINSVKEWGREKNLHDPVMQYAKMVEECGEIAHELTRGHNHTPEMEDAIGDTMVTLVVLADILDFDVMQCLESAYNVIKDRKGKTVNGSFVKEQ